MLLLFARSEISSFFICIDFIQKIFPVLTIYAGYAIIYAENNHNKEKRLSMQEWNPRKLNTEQNLPLYRVLADCLRESIREGEPKCGSRLPSSRELQNAYHLSSSTVEHGVKLLVREGWLLRRPRLGTFVNNPEHRRIVPSKKLRIKVLFSNIGVEGEHWFRGLFSLNSISGNIMRNFFLNGRT